MKKYIKYVAMSTLLLLLLTSLFASKEDMVVKIGDNNEHLVGYPHNDNNRTYLPVRIISEDLGYEVAWRQETQTEVIKKREFYV